MSQIEWHRDKGSAFGYVNGKLEFKVLPAGAGWVVLPTSGIIPVEGARTLAAGEKVAEEHVRKAS